jgi:IS605 OrfB family transposase
LFKDLRKNLSINFLKSTYIAKYGITARQFNAIRVSVCGKIDAVKACRVEHIEQLKEKIPPLEKKIPKIKNKLKRHEKNRSLARMRHRLKRLESDHKKGLVSICFGGKKLFHAQHNLKENGYQSFAEWKKDWVDVRSSEFFCLGSKDETSGNQTCVLTMGEKGHFQVRLRLPDSIAKNYGTKYLKISDVIFPYGHEEIAEALCAKQALTYRFKRDTKGWRVFVSFSQEKAPILTKIELGGIGVDVNEHHIALIEMDRQGNPIDKKTIPLCTYGKSRDQSKALISDVCKEVVAFAKEKQKPIVAENLDFKKKKARLKEESSPKQARMLSSFSYALILEGLRRKSSQEGVAFFTVNPAMTSIIGRIKFAARYGLSVHHAAALCIVRRFFEFSEAPSKCTMRVVHRNVQVTCPPPERKREEPVWRFWVKANKKMKTALAAHFRSSPGPQCSRSG